MAMMLRTAGRVMRRGLVPLAFLGLATPALAADDQDLIKKGEYLVTAGDCVACHTAPKGEKFAGGLYMQTPVGALSTPNLTPDPETGIGKWTDDQFYRAMHEGIDDDGHYLYPAFPFPWFTKVTKDDVHAIKAYLFSLKPVHAPRKEIKIGFPFNIRTGLITWRTLFFKAGTFNPDPKANEELNRGAYLVEGLGHCGECHNHSKLLGASDWSGKLEGGQIEGFYAPNITSSGKDGVGLWKKEDIVTYLKTGAKPDHTSVAAGPMRETIDDSLSKMSDADLGAIAEYLKSTAAKQTITASESSKGVAPTNVSGQAYLTHCASCHQPDGQGVKNAIPALAGNGAVTTKGPENVIRAVLGGLPAMNGLSPMPAYGQTMTNAEIAEAVNYVRHSWGNNAPADVGPGDVDKLREKALTMLSADRPEACIPIADAAKPNKALPTAVDTGDVKDKLEKMSTSDMLTTIDTILPGIKKGAPEATPDQITNALTAAYCPYAMKAEGAEKSVALGNFAVLVYGQAKKKPGTEN